MLIIFDAHKMQNNIVRCYGRVSRHTPPIIRVYVNVYRLTCVHSGAREGQGRYCKSGTHAPLSRVPSPPTMILYIAYI